MGNCIRHDKSSWAADDDDDWGSLVSNHRDGDNGEISSMEKERLLGGGNGKRDANTREVKITISKKELEQLMQKVDMQGLTLEQALARMVNGGGGGGNIYEVVEEHHRPWKPVLQSIPEVN